MFSIRTISRLAGPIVAVTFIYLLVGNTTSAEEKIEWWSTDGKVGQQLISQEKNLVDWAAELAASKAKTPEEAVIKISVCMRAGLDDEACDAIRTLWQFGSDQVDNYLLTSCYYKATDDYLAWDIARTIAETFAPRIHEIALDNRLFKHYRDKDNEKRWSDDEFIAWLDARVESVREYNREQATKANPNDQLRRFSFYSVKPIEYWQRLRLRHLAEMGRADEELRRMESSVRENPADAELTIDFLRSLTFLRNTNSVVKPDSLDWMSDICHPSLATDIRQIAGLLADLKQYRTAEAFFRRAIDTKITDEEISRLSMMCQACLPAKTHRLLFEIGVREDLAKCLLEMGEPKKSQKIMVEAADLRQANNLPFNPYLSGVVQSVSGARVIEGRIREKEQENKDDPEYWRNRADYYRGRGEPAEEEAAIRRGLALCPPEPQPQGKAPTQMRHWLLSSLTNFLIRQHREDEAVAILLKEMKEVPIDAASSKGAARLLAYDLPKKVDPDEPILWAWLSRREKWDNPDERLLWRMLESAPRDSRDKYFTRAEKLALKDGVDASRAATLGWILNRMDEAARSVPLLKHAIETTDDKEQKQKASFTLFESYLDIKDWRAAESMFDVAAQRLSTSEDPEWLGRIARIAAEKGDNEDAMRIFRRVANCNLKYRRLVDELVQFGLKDEISDFYKEVQRKLPTAKLDGMVD